MAKEGIDFQCNVEVGKDLSAVELMKKYDSVLLCLGATHPRDLPIPGIYTKYKFVLEMFYAYYIGD